MVSAYAIGRAWTAGTARDAWVAPPAGITEAA